MIPALISQSKGMAIFDDGKRIACLDIAGLDEPSYDVNRHLLRFQGACDVEPIEVEDVEALSTHLQMRKEREEMLQALVVLIDGAYSKEFRSLAAKTLESRRQADHWSWLEGVLLSCAPPEGADFAGAESLLPERQAIFRRVISNADLSHMLRVAWQALPSTLFAPEESKEELYATVVRSGMASHLALAESSAAEGPFAQALACHRFAMRSHLDEVTASGNSLVARPGVPGDKWFDWIWTARPWQMAFLASEWPSIESKHARDVAHSVFLAAERIFGALSNDAEVHRLLSAWDSKKNAANVSKIVKLLQQFRFADEIEKLHQGDFMHGFDSLEDSQHTASVAKSGASSTFELGPLCTFGLANAPRSYFAHEAAHTGTPSELLARLCECSAISRIDSTKELVLGDVGSWPLTEGEIVQAIGVNKLEQVFSIGGAAINAPIDVDRWHSSDWTNESLVVNLTSSRVVRLKNLPSLLVGVLGNRLTKDMDSGLPKQYWGWQDANKIQSTTELKHVYVFDLVTSVRNELAAAGLSSTILETDENRVRLNPDLAVINKPSKRGS
jgi:hypothetical protein